MTDDEIFKEIIKSDNDLNYEIRKIRNQLSKTKQTLKEEISMLNSALKSKRLLNELLEEHNKRYFMKKYDLLK